MYDEYIKGRVGIIMEAKLWTKNYIMALVVMFFIYLTSAILLSLMAIHAKNLTGLDTYAGLMVSTFTLGALSVRFLAGGLIDKFNSKKVILTGVVVLIFSTAWMLFTNEINQILVARTLQGLGFGLSATATSTLVATICHPNKLLEGISYLSVSQSLTMVIGPSIGFWIIGADYDRFNSLFMVATGLAATTFIIMLFEKGGHKEAHKTQTQVGETKIRWSLIALPLMVLFLNALSQSAITSFLALYAISLGLAGIGSFFSINAAGMITSRFIMNKLVRRFGQFPVTLMNTIIFTASIFMLTQATGIVQMLIIAFPAGFSMGSIAPIINTYVLQTLPSNKRGLANALYFSGLDIGFGLGSVIWGLVASGMGYVQVFYFSAVLQAVAILAIIIQISMTGNRKQKPLVRGV